MLPVLDTVRVLRLTKEGHLQRWLGPALRGLVGHFFKADVCRHSQAEQREIWTHCRGCPYMRECPYGQTLEPDPPLEADVFKGQEEAAKPVVISPVMLDEPWADVDSEIPVRVTFVGHSAIAHAEAFWDSMASAGNDPKRGLGLDHVTFETLDDPDELGGYPPAHQSFVDVPLSPSAMTGTIPFLKVEMISPLILKTKNTQGKKQLVQKPKFSDLLSGCLRTVGQLFALYDERLPAAFPDLKVWSTEVKTYKAGFLGFQQRRWSNRQEQGGMLRGIVGSVIYRDVPLSLVRWVYWGGRLHVGGQRVSGAGGWHLSWSEERRMVQQELWHEFY
ncbi:MAG: CRISPR system precrRNA processing endoribonuclease RAMP protein Cas6 [Gemmataceae bacterium]